MKKNLYPLASLLFLFFGMAITLDAQEPDWLESGLNPFGLSVPLGEDTLSRVILTDIDHDDTLEAFIQTWENIPPFSWHELTYFENMQTDENPQFGFVETFPFGIPDNSPNWLWKFADIDGDEKEDFVAYKFSPTSNPVTLKYNSGPSVEEPDFSGSFVYNPYGITLPVASDNGNVWDGVAPTFVDIDTDGDLDLFYGGLFLDNEYNEAFYFSENTGTPTDPQYAAPVADTFGLTYPQNILSLHWNAFADVDCDGDLDMYYQGRSSGQNFYYFFENTGTPISPDFSSMYTPTSVRGVMGSFVDIGGDGDLDLIAFRGQDGGKGVWFYENPTHPEVVDFNYTVNVDGATYTFTNTSSDRPIRYHWNFGDGGTSDEENPVYTFTQSGTYEVCLTAGGGVNCQNTHCESIEVIVSSIEDLQLDASLKLNPNPASGLLTIELESREHPGIVDIEIFDWSGQNKTKFSRQVFGNVLRESINLEDLPVGVYTLKVSSEGKFIARNFIIVD